MGRRAQHHQKGANYGWPIQEGNCNSCPYANPVFAYPHVEGWASIMAPTVFAGSSFGPQYEGAVFYGDYVLSEIRYLVFDENYETVISDNEFEPDAGTVVDIVEDRTAASTTQPSSPAGSTRSRLQAETGHRSCRRPPIQLPASFH